MARVALKLAYDGGAFHGSQRQPGLRTVEGDLLSALAKLDAVADARAARFEFASRTDAGVSASGNVVAFDTEFPAEGLCGALEHHLEDAWPLAVAVVPPEFRPRHARLRRYRYRLALAGLDARRLDDALRIFEGEHDFTAFSRLEAHRSPRRRLDCAKVEGFEGPDFVLLHFEAHSFLWNQVRRIVAAAEGIACGRVDAAVVEEALRSGKGPDLGLAPAENLVLLDVVYAGLDWRRNERAAERVRADLEARRLDAALAAGRLRDHLEAVREGGG